MTTRRGFGPRLALTTLAVAALAFLDLSPAAAAPGAGEPVTGGVLRMNTMAVYRDGSAHFTTREFVGTPERAWDVTDASNWVTVGSRVTNTHHWEPGSKITYGTTELARENPGFRLLKKAAGLINKNRGTARAPSHKITKGKHDIIPENQFASFSAYISQFHADGRNTIVMDALDEFIDTISRALGGAVITPDVFAIQYEFAQISPVGNRLEGTFWIENVDIYLISDYFARFAGFDLNDGLAFGFLANSGYEPTGWTDDAMGFVNAHVNPASYDNRQSDMWKQHQERDRFYYDDLTRNSTQAVLHLIPIPGSVIDIGGNIAWYDGVEPAPGEGPVLIESRLKAFNGNKKAVTTISRIEFGPPDKLRRVVTLRDNLEDWPRNDRGIGQWFPTVFYNAVRIAREKDLEKLVNAIDQFGTPMQVRGVNFPKVLPVQIKHVAYVSENGGKQTQTGIYYLIDSSSSRIQ